MRGTESAEYGEDYTVSKQYRFIEPSDPLGHWVEVGKEPSKTIYLIGSLRNPEVPKVANTLRDIGFDVFDDWYAAGPEADDYWRQYEIDRGHTYQQALRGYAAEHVYSYDKHHLDRADAGVLLLPAGRSGHLELGYLAGRGKPVYIVLDKEYDRWDVMYKFAKVVGSVKELTDNFLGLNGWLDDPLR